MTAPGTSTSTTRTSTWWSTGASCVTISGRPIFTSPRFADGQTAAHERLRVEALDHFLADGPFGELHKRKATGTTGFPIDRHHHM